jgi:hypothetical protein
VLFLLVVVVRQAKMGQRLTVGPMLVIDESHEGVDTFKTDIAFENINRDFTLALIRYAIQSSSIWKICSEDQIYNWTYADEQQAKAAWDKPQENNPYEKLPRLSYVLISNEPNDYRRSQQGC